MSHTNTTTNYGLPQFITTDKPAWLTDVNVAYSAIDTAMKNNQTAAASAQSDATQALSDASGADTKATTADSKASGAIASIADTFSATDTYNVGDLVIYNNLLYRCTVAITVPGAWSGSDNWTRETIENKIDALSGSNIPMEAGSSTMINTKFGQVDSAINSKVSASDMIVKSKGDTNIQISADGYDTRTIAANNSVFKCIVGVAITANTNIVPIQFYFDENGNIILRTRNLTSLNTTYGYTVYYI